MRASALLLLAACALPAQHKTENAVLVSLDEQRWQEVFSGPDNRVMNRFDGGVRDVRALRRGFLNRQPRLADRVAADTPRLPGVQR